MSQDLQKRRAAQAAADLVRSDMVVGLGTGSTARHLVDILAERAGQGLDIRAIPTSEDTRQQAEAGGIILIEPDETTQIDLCIDGTDEVDGQLRLIKGGGGALLREKIVARAARKMVVIADESKRVQTLGRFALPVEVSRFCWSLTVQRVREVLGRHGLETVRVQLRPGSREAGGGVFVSDGGNYILDLHCGRIENPEGLHDDLIHIPGVVETGLFLGLADKVILATEDSVEILEGMS